MGVTLRKRKNGDGSISLRLDVIHDGKRTIETLPYKLRKAVSPADREANKQVEAMARSAASKRDLEIKNSGFIAPIVKQKVPVVEWMQAYCDGYTMKDKRNMQGVTKRFASFLVEEKKQGLMFRNLTEQVVEDFWGYLKDTCTGEGDRSYFTRFKKMMKRAYKEKMLVANVAADVMADGGGSAKKKDILTLPEIQTLATTQTENQQVKQAFLFSCVTGLRWCDVKALRWQDVDKVAGTMTVIQEKTDKPVTVPLNSTAIALLPEQGKPQQHCFVLPTANGANKTLKAWVRRAGISKKITWHNARHSFGTNLILTETDVVTASKLLGHTSLKHTQRYVDSADHLKRKAVNGLQIVLS